MKDSKVELLERLSAQVQEVEAEIEKMREKVTDEYCELPSEIG
jgi:phage host-nuclease inhibitor protein Gam